VKTQTVRLLDVFVIGPLLLVASARAVSLSRPERIALALTGVATIWYNGRNYLRK